MLKPAVGEDHRPPINTEFDPAKLSAKIAFTGATVTLFAEKIVGQNMLQPKVSGEAQQPQVQ